MGIQKSDNFSSFQIEMRKWYKEKDRNKISMFKYVFIMLFIFIALLGIGSLIQTQKIVKEDRYLEENELINYSKDESALIRNEIFAIY